MNKDSLRHIPNIISMLRILLIIPIIIAIWKNEYRLALVLIFIAGVSDGIDGFLARAFNWRSRLGGILDPLADKILLMSLFVVFTFKGLLPMWLMYLVVTRDIVILGGAIAYHFVTHQLEMRPLIVSKINTGLQIALILLVALILAEVAVAPWMLNAMIVAVAISTLASGISYVVLWTRYTVEAKTDQ